MDWNKDLKVGNRNEAKICMIYKLFQGHGRDARGKVHEERGNWRLEKPFVRGTSEENPAMGGKTFERL